VKKLPTPNRDQQQLNRWADVILGIPVGSNLAPKRPMPEFWISDEERFSIALCLRRLAQTPEALKMLEIPRVGPGPGRPVKSESRQRASKIAFDYELSCERLGKSEAALLEVGKAWKIGRSTVLKAHQEWSALQSQKNWVMYERKSFAANHPRMKPERQLLKMSKTLRSQKSKNLGPVNSE
jgi:hypothetical protein